jgi:hypothetical protein
MRTDEHGAEHLDNHGVFKEGGGEKLRTLGFSIPHAFYVPGTPLNHSSG